MAKGLRRFAFALVMTVMSCRSGPPAPSPAAQPAPAAPVARLFTDLGRFHRTVTTTSVEAQLFFDQGLLFCFGFNHEEAIRSFQRAAELDPNCAMAFWGAALASGPNINNPTMDEAASRAAADAIARAQALVVDKTPVERELIAALARRYVFPPPADRGALDQAYADAMRDVWHRHGDDADVGALFAESMLDLRPWNQWTKDGKQMIPFDDSIR